MTASLAADPTLDESGGLSESLFAAAEAAFLAILGADRSDAEPEKMLDRDRALLAAWLKRTRALRVRANPEQRERLDELIRSAESHIGEATRLLRRYNTVYRFHLHRRETDVALWRTEVGRAPRAATNTRRRGSVRGSCGAGSPGGSSDDPELPPELTLAGVTP